MSTHKSVLVVLVTLAFALVSSARAQAPTSEEQAARADNYYAAGNHIEINSAMPADVIVAGRQVDIARPVAGDILAAGWRVVLSGRADDDVRIAAGEVTIDAPVAGDLTVAGGDVTIGPQTHVGGRSWLTGRTVRVEGVLDRELRVAGATVQLAGEIRQPVQIVAEQLEILPSARLLSTLTYKGPTEVRIADGAIVNGPITYDRIPAREAQRARAFPAISSGLFALHLFLAGLLVVFFLPQFETSMIATFRAQPGWSLLTGFVLVVTTPVAAVLLIVSILGLPFGLAMAALYAISLFAGVVATAFFVGDAEARLFKTGPIVNRGQHAMLLFAGVLTLAVLRSLLGGVIVLVSVLFGLGALMLAVHRTYVHQNAPAPA